MRTALSWHRVIIPAAEIDACGLHVCNIAGMRRALAGLSCQPGYVLTDGFAVRGLGVPALAMWKGDEVSGLRRGRLDRGQGHQGPHHDRPGRAVPGVRIRPAQGVFHPQPHARRWRQHGPCPEHRASFANVNGLVRDLPVVDPGVRRPEAAAGGRGPERPPDGERAGPGGQPGGGRPGSDTDGGWPGG